MDKIRELVAMMVEHELTEVELRDGEECVVIKRGGASPAAPPIVALAPHVGPATAPVPAAGGPAAASPPADDAPKPDDGLVPIRSPMVGTFYAAPDPDTSPYVTVGSQVEPDTIVAIIEAMKVFNEIKAEVSGTIEQVLVRNEQPVEYGQPLFLVRPRA